MSHVRVAPRPADLHSVRVATGEADLVLGCDMVVAASAAALDTYDSATTRAIVNNAVEPTAAFVLDRDADLHEAGLRRAIAGAAREADFVDATRLATALLGDAIASNLFLLGYAFQKGLVPVSLEAIGQAIELNGIAVKANRTSFAWGRRAAHDLAAVEAAAKPVLRLPPRVPTTLPEIVEHRARFLAQYQDEAYAARYRGLVGEVEKAEREKAKGMTGLAEAVAKNLFKLMAVKDEYEVARLYTDGAFMENLRRTFEGDFKLEFHLAPPIFGEERKRAYGPWMMRVFRLLARLRRLRGTPFDVFARTEERKMERRLLAEYETMLREVTAALSPANHRFAAALASLPDQIRGFGHVKLRAVEAAKKRETDLLAQFRAPAAPPAVAAE
jgi:indolepyruvate ferredoxin oxidoreductase